MPLLELIWRKPSRKSWLRSWLLKAGNDRQSVLETPSNITCQTRNVDLWNDITCIVFKIEKVYLAPFFKIGSSFKHFLRDLAHKIRRQMIGFDAGSHPSKFMFVGVVILLQKGLEACTRKMNGHILPLQNI